MPALVSKSLRDYRRALIGWTIGLCAFLLLYLSVYPSITSDPELYGRAAAAKYPGALKDLMGGLDNFTTGAGYLQVVAYQLFGPLLLIMCAVVLGNRVVAQPEETGTLELTLTLPIDRRRLVLERYAALVLGLLGVMLVTFALVAGMAAANGMGVPLGNIAAAHAGLYLLVLLFGTVTVAVGAATGRKGLALAVTGVWAVGGYVVETLGRDVAAISWLRWLSPFHYYLDGKPLYQGFPFGDYGVLAGVTVLLLLAAMLAFDRRDVGV
ncbi:ABC transporter permease subunit [Streptosporangium sp. NPDC051023]|uniref:ABC transporter permease subunit n=1 Tax=Streptosporangium sp. NPDC051023 TaxID=3155410 RepID=UPI00344B44F6